MELSSIVVDTAKVILPGLVVAVVTALVTVRLALRRFHVEKWWERKEQAYSNLIDIVYTFQEYTSKHLDDELDPERFSAAEKKEWEAEWKVYSKRYSRARGLASLHLSKRALDILQTYERDKARAENVDVRQWMENDLEAITKCLDALIAAAKADLNVK